MGPITDMRKGGVSVSEKGWRRLWALCLVVDGVCAIVLGVMTILDLAPAVRPVLCVLLSAALSATFVSTAQIYRREKDREDK